MLLNILSDACKPRTLKIRFIHEVFDHPKKKESDYKITQKISPVSWQIVCEVGEIPQLEIENCLLEINKRGAVVVEPP